MYVLHSKVAMNSSDSLGHLSLIRFAKGLQPHSIKLLKKVMIFIREKEEVLQETSTLMRELMIKVLRASPNAVNYKEFFSFFREIFYYNKDMD